MAEPLTGRVPGGWRRRGTARNPGPDLQRLPVGLDFSGISLAEGLRAALASGVFLVPNLWLQAEPLLIAATGAMITCFCDVGGTLRQRLPMLLSFTLLGAFTWGVFGLVRALGDAPVLLLAAPVVFVLSMARVWGLRAQTVGNILIVVLALAIDRPLSLSAAEGLCAFFVTGGLWACLLTLVIWRISADRPVLQAVDQVFGALQALAADLRRLVQRDAQPGDWDAHALAHRRAVRAQIEAARLLLASGAGGRGIVSRRSQRAALLLEAAEQLFGELIVLSEMLESATDPSVRQEAERLLRRVRPLLAVLASGRGRGGARLEASIDSAAAPLPPGPLQVLSGLILDRLRMVVRAVEVQQDESSLRQATAPPAKPWWSRRVWSPLRDELTPRSAILRHALRATLLTVPAIAITLLWWTPYAHWLTITVALTMQPFFAATWQRALERIGGTALGAMLGGALAFLPSTPLAVGGAVLVMAVVGFSVRQVSYGAYIACLTPLIVLLFDIAAPGHSPWVVAGMRVLYTLVGGFVAVSACLLLWPSWEPDRLRQELRGTLLAYAGLADAILDDPRPEPTGPAEAARRSAGLANSNLEASLSRALQEPGRRHRAELVKLIAADAVLRRLGATLLAIPYDAALGALLAGPARHDWQRHLRGAFEAIAEGRPVPPDPGLPAPPTSTLARACRALDLLSASLVPGQPPGVSKAAPALSRS